MEKKNLPCKNSAAPVELGPPSTAWTRGSGGSERVHNQNGCLRRFFFSLFQTQHIFGGGGKKKKEKKQHAYTRRKKGDMEWRILRNVFFLSPPHSLSLSHRHPSVECGLHSISLALILKNDPAGRIVAITPEVQ